ncbi:MAG TPA: hypothetical protein VE548_13630 [Nitrososphaeraceae archaeon]|jgi:hypothetical protein|nr:hypothetical protein [Nitrososphaeraceae archaeon]
MTRSFKDWWNTIPSDLKEKALNGDESDKPSLNQVNYALLHLELEGRHEAKPSHGELRTWLHSGQVGVVMVK